MSGALRSIKHALNTGEVTFKLKKTDWFEDE
jgi:hypothetical protein